jgi:hypothetical protein
MPPQARNRQIRTDRTFELGVSPLVRGAWLLLRLSSVACGAIAVVVDMQLRWDDRCVAKVVEAGTVT